MTRRPMRDALSLLAPRLWVVLWGWAIWVRAAAVAAAFGAAWYRSDWPALNHIAVVLAVFVVAVGVWADKHVQFERKWHVGAEERLIRANRQLQAANRDHDYLRGEVARWQGWDALHAGQLDRTKRLLREEQARSASLAAQLKAANWSGFKTETIP